MGKTRKMTWVKGRKMGKTSARNPVLWDKNITRITTNL